MKLRAPDQDGARTQSQCLQRVCPGAHATVQQ
jgi:hypothetical protein